MGSQSDIYSPFTDISCDLENSYMQLVMSPIEWEIPLNMITHNNKYICHSN